MEKCVPFAHVQCGPESNDQFVKKLGAGFVVCTVGGKVLADNVAQGLAALR